MKLYLCSYRIPTPDDLFELLGKSAHQTKVALISNAKDYYADYPRSIKIQDVSDYFQELGFQYDVVDLRDFDDAGKIKEALTNYDLIWVMGGNTFMLRYEMRRSGFEKVITGLLEAGAVYGGESAGAAVAGNSLRGIEFADDSRFPKEIIWEGLGLTDHFILPHTDGSPFGYGIEQAEELHNDDTTMIKITDAQAFVVDGSDERTATAHE